MKTVKKICGNLLSHARAFSLLIILILFAEATTAQNGGFCYTPMSGYGKQATAVQSGVLCLACTFLDTAANVTDANKNNFANFNTAVGLLSGNGISVVDTINTYPAGWEAGYVVDLGNGVLTANVLSSFTLETYNNGVLQESKTANNGVSVSLLSGNSGKVYLNFKTTLPFDEVRFVFNSVVGGLSAFRVYYAMAFDSNCGTPYTSGICYKQIAGPQSTVNFNGGLLNALVTLTNPGNITDGDKTTYATLTVPAATPLLSAPVFVGATDLQTVYPAGNKAGLAIGYSSSLLTANVLNSLTIETFLHGQLQDSVNLGSGSGVTLSALAAGDTAEKEVSITTTKPFNEIRLLTNNTLGVNVGSIRVYYVFESGAACTDCKQVLTSTQAAPYTGAIQASRTGSFGVVCIGQSFSGTANVVDASTTNFATYTPAILSVGCGAQLSVTNGTGGAYPANTVAGFAISRQSTLLDLGILGAITINLYNNGTLTESKNGNSLLGVGLLNPTSGTTFIGFKSTQPFNEVQIRFDAGLISASLGGTYNIYYAYIVRDDDGDGVPDCAEVCGLTKNDAIDSDGDGIPDACDNCNALNQKIAFVDTDGDGISDACDQDSDNDGISDIREDTNHDGDPTNDDADGDGIPNYLDLDSDNDGVPDLYESGIPVATLNIIDANHDGVIDNTVSVGINGLADILEAADLATSDNNYVLADKDGDGIPDFVDLDSDNDGINDIKESGRTGLVDANNDGIVDGPDSDRDGIMDSADGNNSARGGLAIALPRDTDGDGVADMRDLDSDNDGINDIKESGQTFTDANNDGMADAPDADGDGIPNSVDGRDGFGDGPDAALKDTDGDTIADYRDLDSDNDGINDVKESGLPLTADADGNGMVDGTDTDGDGIVGIADGAPAVYGDAADPALKDTDGDTVPDYRDLDSDNDGINDVKESGLPLTADADGNGMVDGTDTDGDGIVGIADGAPAVYGDAADPALRDSDGDTIPDFRDLDSDNDGINDVKESGLPLTADADGNGMVDGTDTDGDGIVGVADGAPAVYGDLGDPALKDTDGDSIPDYRDLDSDNDGISDLVEYGAPGYIDANNDGVVDGPDTDGDGIQNSVDGLPAAFGDAGDPNPVDTDGDGIPDYNDGDSNNDGINDIVDNGLGYLDMNGDGKVDNPTDGDGDGIANNDGLDFKPTTFGGLGKVTLLNVQVLLQGALLGNGGGFVMRDNLRQNGLVPLTQPYNTGVSARFASVGGGDEHTVAAVLAANAGTSTAVVDWVLIELRDSTNPSTVVHTVAGLLRRDGQIVGADGNKLGVMLPVGKYFLAIKHRNHLGVMTSTAIITAAQANAIDFKTAPTYGTGAQILVGSGNYAMWAGDVNSDGRVYFTAPANDRDASLSQLGGSQFGFLTTYKNCDINLDGQSFYTAPNNDRDILLAGPLLGLEFGFIQEQLP